MFLKFQQGCFLLVLIGWMGAVCFSCSSSGVTSDDGGTDGMDGGGDGGDGNHGCQRDGACPANQVCDEQTGLCQDGIPCDADYNCASNEYCEPAGKVCKTIQGLCQACEDSAECGRVSEGNLCIAYSAGKYCGKACGSKACPVGYTCDFNSGSGTGPNKGQCRSNTNLCGGTFVCHQDGDCAGNKICNLQNGNCVPKCVQDSDCATGQKCHYTGHCGEACANDDDCGSGLICCTPGRGYCDSNSTGRCRPDGCVLHSECSSQAESGALGYCDKRGNQCMPGCRFADENGSTGDCTS
jgi:hypothetical protein